MMPENTDENKHATDLSSLLSTIISNPDAMTKINQTISKFIQEPNSTSSSQSEENPANENKTDINDTMTNTEDEMDLSTSSSPEITNVLLKLPSIIGNLSSSSNEGSLADKQQIALLLAIRPYLSPHRRELIDTFIKMNKFSAIFMSLNDKGGKNVL